MHEVSEAEKDAFFQQVAKASAEAVWCAIATAARSSEPRVELSEMFGSTHKRVWRAPA